LARAECFEVEGGGNFAVGEGESGRGGKDVESGSSEEEGVLQKGLLFEGVESGREVGVGFVEESLAAGALGSKGSGFIDGKGEDRSKEEVGSFVGSSVRMFEDVDVGKDTETSETSGKADDGCRLGVAGADSGA
jgi:hypothetical protein